MEKFVCTNNSLQLQLLRHYLFLPGRLVHLSPPGVVSVVDDKEDLTPQQHQGGVSGDQALHHAVQPLQGVKQASLGASLSTSTLTLQETGSCNCDPAKHSLKEEESKRWKFLFLFSRKNNDY